MQPPLIWSLLSVVSLAVFGISAFWLQNGTGVLIGAVAGVLCAIGALVTGISEIRLRERKIGAAVYTVAAVLSGIGFASWFFSGLGTINLFGAAAVVIGVVLLVISGVWLVWRR